MQRKIRPLFAALSWVTDVILVYSSSSSSCTGIGFPVELILGAAGADENEGAVAALGAAAGALLKLKLLSPRLADAENPLPELLNEAPNPLDDGELGAGLGGAPLFAASRALACRSLSPPASMIPLRVPVKNVAIGIISSKNF